MITLDQTKNVRNIRQKEKKRTECINKAFSELRKCIPNVPPDTKLSKIKTLRLASAYIAYLSDIRESSEQGDSRRGEDFCADLKILKCRERRKTFRMEIEKSRDESEGSCSKSHLTGTTDQIILKADSPKCSQTKKGRTGWPECVWADALGSLHPKLIPEDSLFRSEECFPENNFYIPATTSKFQEFGFQSDQLVYQQQQQQLVDVITHTSPSSILSRVQTNHNIDDFYDPRYQDQIEDHIISSDSRHLNQRVNKPSNPEIINSQSCNQYAENMILEDFSSGGADLAGRILTSLPSISTLCNSDRFNVFPDSSLDAMEFQPTHEAEHLTFDVQASNNSSPDFTELQPVPNSFKYSDDKSIMFLNQIDQIVN